MKRSRDDLANLSRLVRSATRGPADPVPNLKGRIRNSLRRKSAQRRRYLRAALLGGVLLLAGSVVAAIAPPIFHLLEKRRIDSVASIDPSPPAARARLRKAATTPTPIVDEDPPLPVKPADPLNLPPAPAPAPPPPTSAIAPNKRSVGRALASTSKNDDPARTATPFTPRPSFSPTYIEPAPLPFVAAPPSEQALLSRAVRGLRSEHQPGNALAVLDEYMARFPSGSLLPSPS